MSLSRGHFTGTSKKEAEYRYHIYLPDDYDSMAQEWPLILFLHGMGERGDDLNLVRKNGPLRQIEDGIKLPFIIVAPQCPADSWWDADNLATLLGHIKGEFRVDGDRVYLTGVSMGGSGTWALANACPERFAAIAPVCAFFTPGDPRRLKELPIWCFHGAMDEVVPVNDSLRMVTWIREHGGNAKCTIYPDIAHNCWREVYSNSGLYQWFLENKKSSTDSTNKRVKNKVIGR